MPTIPKSMYQNSIIRQLKVIQIISETKDAKTFVLEPLHSWKPAYQAGQFLTLVFDTEHGEKRRSYSISSSPVTDAHLAITVKQIENGEFSRFLIQQTAVGDVLSSSGIAGQFVLPAEHTTIRQFFFIAAGSGITPCFSLIKTLLETTAGKVTLIYSNKSPEDTIFYQALGQLQLVHAGRLSVKFLFSNGGSIYDRRLSSWLLDQLVDQYLAVKPQEAMFYVCGPFDYMLTVKITLQSRFPADHIKREDYSSLPRLKKIQPSDTDSHHILVTINGQAFSFSAQYPDTILDAAIKQGLQLPYSCKAGRCASCIATCRSGKVWMAYNEVLTDREVEQGRILVCQSYAVGGDVEIGY